MAFSVLKHIKKADKNCVGCCIRSLTKLSSTRLQAFQGTFGQPVEEGEDFSLKDRRDSVDPKQRLKDNDYFNVKELVNMKELFDARVHLGHTADVLDPFSRRFIYGHRARHHVIDLSKTVPLFRDALNVLSHVVYNRGIVCFASTDPRHDYLLQKAARTSGEYFITREWKKGQFTNSLAHYNTDVLPDVIIAFNITRFQKIRELIVEASMCNIPIIGLIDTDCDGKFVTYPIPGNDDTPESVKKICEIFQNAILNAKAKRLADDTKNLDSKFER